MGQQEARVTETMTFSVVHQDAEDLELIEITLPADFETEALAE